MVLGLWIGGRLIASHDTDVGIREAPSRESGENPCGASLAMPRGRRTARTRSVGQLEGQMVSGKRWLAVATKAWVFIVLGIALGAGCSSSNETCNLAGPVTVDVDASTDGLPADGGYGPSNECTKFCDPNHLSCQRLSDTQVRCSNDGVGCL